MSGQRGLPPAMLEPPAAIEDNAEHFPERAALDDFLTARRVICVDGWPRYLTVCGGRRDASHIAIDRGLREQFEAQVQLFMAYPSDGTDHLGIVELRGAMTAESPKQEAFAPAAHVLDIVNGHVAYERRTADEFPKTT